MAQIKDQPVAPGLGKKRSWWRRLFSRKKKETPKEDTSSDSAPSSLHPAEDADLQHIAPDVLPESHIDKPDSLEGIEIAIIPFVGPRRKRPTFAYYPYPGAQPKGHVGIVLDSMATEIIRSAGGRLPRGVKVLPAAEVDWDNVNTWLRWSMYPSMWPLQNVQRYEVVINSKAMREEEFLNGWRCYWNMEYAHAEFARMLIRNRQGAQRFFRVVRL